MPSVCSDGSTIRFCRIPFWAIFAANSASATLFGFALRTFFSDRCSRLKGTRKKPSAWVSIMVTVAALLMLSSLFVKNGARALLTRWRSAGVAKARGGSPGLHKRVQRARKVGESLAAARAAPLAQAAWPPTKKGRTRRCDPDSARPRYTWPRSARLTLSVPPTMMWSSTRTSISASASLRRVVMR